jgi:imidazolonepropionase-like amidohydrolase
VSSILLRPAAVFDGDELHDGWHVLIDGDRIVAADAASAMGAISAVGEPGGARAIDLPGTTLLPGLIDLHTHLLLHPYDERPWADQVLRDHESLRVARAVVAAKRTLAAGFTTVRDLGTEGAGEADVGLRRAIEEGVIEGPRLVCVTRAIVARGTYGPTGFHSGCCVPQGADEVDGPESILRATRMQIARGADWIKVYADYRFGPANDARPTFSQEELALIVRVAHDAGVPVAAHATTAEGMRRAALAGVQTIEHGNEGTPEVFALLAERGIAYVPTLAAYEALERIRGLSKDHPTVVAKRAAFDAARASGVTIANGSDIGVFAHGQNARELELLVEHGLTPTEALRAATSTAARVLRRDDLGLIAAEMRADLVCVQGDPAESIAALRDVRLVLRDGVETYGAG